jgi:hypothetical protein
MGMGDVFNTSLRDSRVPRKAVPLPRWGVKHTGKH